MYVWLRVPQIIRAAKQAPRVDVEDKVEISLRVLPGDIDAFGHLNNGRYLTLCDLGRYAMSIRTGMMGVFAERRWFPVVAAATVRFRRSLEVMQAFSLSTQILYWDHKWFYIEHLFVRDGDIYSRVLIKGTVLSAQKKAVPIEELVAALREEQRPAKPMPETVRIFNELLSQ